MNNQQRATYKPTPAEVKILTVLANPDMQHRNIKQMCELAGVDRSVYYQAIKKPGFNELYKETLFNLIKNASGDMIKAAVDYAKEGNHNYFKTLMEMGSLYVPKQQQEISGKDGGPIQFERLLDELD
jgi:hypothetical protein